MLCWPSHCWLSICPPRINSQQCWLSVTSLLTIDPLTVDYWSTLPGSTVNSVDCQSPHCWPSIASLLTIDPLTVDCQSAPQDQQSTVLIVNHLTVDHWPFHCWLLILPPTINTKYALAKWSRFWHGAQLLFFSILMRFGLFLLLNKNTYKHAPHMKASWSGYALGVWMGPGPSSKTGLCPSMNDSEIKEMLDQSPFRGATEWSYIGLPVTLPMGFKARVVLLLVPGDPNGHVWCYTCLFHQWEWVYLMHFW